MVWWPTDWLTADWQTDGHCALIALWLLSECSLSALWVLSECYLSAIWVLSECALTADLFLTDCLKIWARMMKIDCSRQTDAGRTDRQTDGQTDIVTPWAPVGAKKNCVLWIQIYRNYVLTRSLGMGWEQRVLNILSSDTLLKYYLLVHKT